MPHAVRMDLYIPAPANIGYQLTDKVKITYGGAEFQGIQVPVHFPTKVAWPHGFIESEIPANEATKEEGERMLDAVAQYLVDFLAEFRKVHLPSSD